MIVPSTIFQHLSNSLKVINTSKASIFCFMANFAINVVICALQLHPGVAPGIFRRGAHSSNEGAKIWLSGYYKCQKSSKKSLFTF